MNISATSWTIASKFNLKHHWGGVKAAIGFWPDQIGTLVSMARDSSHRVIMGKRTTMISQTSSIFGQIRPRTAELDALERLKKFP